MPLGRARARSRVAIGIDVVAQGGGSHALVPELRANEAARRLSHRRLRHADVEPQAGHLERHRRPLDQRRPIHAVRRAACRQSIARRLREFSVVEPDLVQDCAIDARLGAIAAGLRHEAHRRAACPLAVDLQVYQIVAGQHRIALRESRDVHLGSAAQERRIEFHLWSVRRLRRGAEQRLQQLQRTEQKRALPANGLGH